MAAARVRQWGGFDTRHDENWLAISGVLINGMKIEADAIHIFRPLSFGQSVLLFPLDAARCRAYFVTGRRGEHRWLSGTGDFRTFIDYCVTCGAPSEWFEGADIAGPLATFEAADSWVDRPYHNGVVLIGDAAASNDPSWGCGLSLMFRDVRTLRDRLTSVDNWDTAAGQYASEHDAYYGRLRTIVSWLRTVLYGLGSEADGVREHASARMAESPDLVGKGPDNPTDDAARIRFLGA
jgi:2-polyprenyl-6-methoxyphenol hydroxylase-like FAD-dependent oxidoreductase